MNHDHIVDDEIITDPLFKASKSFFEGYNIAKTDLERTGVVKLFELCYELSWKTLKKLLTFKGIEVNNPRDTFREAGIQNLIDHPKTWFDFIKKRNETVHKYGQELVESIYEILPEFKFELDKLLIKISEMEKSLIEEQNSYE